MIKKIFSNILVALFYLISYLPFTILYCISDFLYIILYHVVGYRKKVVRLNLENSFPEKSEKELLEIEKKFYHHLTDLFIEIIKYRTISEKEIVRRCKFKNIELLKSGKIKDRSFICIQGHYGNWEWPTYIDKLISQKVLSVYKPLHNEAEDEFMIAIRKRFGAITVAKNNILRVLARRHKKGEISAVGLLSDQTPKVNKMTHWMDFLQQDTPVFIGAEKIAKMFDMPVVFLHSTKVKRGYYEIDFRLVTDDPKNTETNEITEAHVRMTEQMIREVPEYWMWSHRRWKRKHDVSYD